MSNNYSKSNRRSFLSKAAIAGAGVMAAPMLNMSTYGQGLIDAKERTPQASAPSDLKITAVKVAYSRMGGMFVKIETNQGLVGWGEGVDAASGSYYIIKRMGAQLIGRSPLNPNVLAHNIRQGAIFNGAQGGVFVAALTGIEAALWDLTGKALGLPLYQLMGGKFRDKCRVYCDTELYAARNPTPADYAKAARGAVDRGYTAIKFDLDLATDPNKYDRVNWTGSLAECERMYNAIEAVRKEVGSHIDICCDMHGRYDAPTGRRVAKMMEPLNLMWLEEPIPADNLEVYKSITQETSTPICAGENIYLTYGFARLLAENALDIIMPDLQKCGGLGEGLRIASLADTYYTPFSPHMVGSYVGAMASAHVCAATPNFHILEWQTKSDTDQEWKDIVIYDKPFIEKGYLVVSDKPGVGVDVNVEGLKKYAIPGVPFFE